MSPLETFMADRLREMIERLENEVSEVEGLIRRGPSGSLETQLSRKRDELRAYRHHLTELLLRVEALR